tara:strand:+ start:354 stop:482 length:129 start_codon:yes stop_codon:yes gene_type:complete
MNCSKADDKYLRRYAMMLIEGAEKLVYASNDFYKGALAELGK